MKNANSLPGKLCSRWNSESQSQNQLQIIFAYLQNHIGTASMVAAATSVPQKCITRYKWDLEKAGQLWETDKKPCEKTRFKAWYLTTNPENAPEGIPIQLNLF